MENRTCVFFFLILCLLCIALYTKLSFIVRIKGVLQYEVSRAKSHPNIILILTDDQDLEMGSFDHMEKVKKLLIQKGITFNNSYVTSPLCCPSRSSILTGKHVHNHKAINNSLSGGCSSISWQRSSEKKTFAVSLQQNSYTTFFAGKYLNQYGHSSVGGLNHIPPGWDWWIGLQGNSVYYNYNLSVNGTKESHGDSVEDYLPNVMRKRALEFLETRITNPFFMMLSTPSCHGPFIPEPMYSKNFSLKYVPRSPNFNIANKGKHWLLRLGEQPLRQKLLVDIDDIYRNRLRTLLTVDDIVSDIYKKLQEKSMLQNTYIIFTSDNGYHLGHFSLAKDKRQPYELDIKVPLVMTGPGISQDTSFQLVSNIDLAPTILDLAGIPIPPTYDGTSLRESLGLRKTILIEYFGEGKSVNIGCEELGSNLSGCQVEFDCKCTDSRNNTYACLRHLSGTENFVYCSFDDEDSFEEYYDLNSDPFQLTNSIQSLSSRFLRKVKYLLSKYRKCRGAHCRRLSKFVI